MYSHLALAALLESTHAGVTHTPEEIAKEEVGRAGGAEEGEATAHAALPGGVCRHGEEVEGGRKGGLEEGERNRTMKRWME